MWNRLFTIISRTAVGLFLAAMLFLPVVLTESYLVKPYSGVGVQVTLVESSLANLEGRKLLLVGDSTIRELHKVHNDIEDDKIIANVAAGGSISTEWYYFVRAALEHPNSIESIVIGMSVPNNMDSTFRKSAYLPFFVRPGDIIEMYQQGALKLGSAIEMFHYSIFRMLFLRDEFLFSFSHKLNNPLSGIFMRVRTKSINKDSQAPPPLPYDFVQSNQYMDIQKILELAKRHGKSVHFIRSPAASALRSSESYRLAGLKFKKVCESLRLSCVDFSTLLEDGRFAPDNTHVKAGSAFLFKQALEEKFL